MGLVGEFGVLGILGFLGDEGFVGLEVVMLVSIFIRWWNDNDIFWVFIFINVNMNFVSILCLF